jgi:hypothetical protein
MLPLWLAACESQDVTVKVDREEAAPVEVAAPVEIAVGETATAAPLPDFLTPYPGARMKARISGPEGLGRVLVMVSDDPVAKIAAFYDAAAKRVGAEPSMMVDDLEDGDAVRMWGRPDGGGALLAISPNDEGPGTEIVITTGMGGGRIAQEIHREVSREVSRELAQRGDAPPRPNGVAGVPARLQ